MSYFSIILLAIALSIDACVVSFSYGLAFTENRFKNAIRLAACTGLFQGLMPVIGYYLTGFVKSFIEPYAGFIVFAIFTYLGVKFIKEAFEKRKKNSFALTSNAFYLSELQPVLMLFQPGFHYHFSEIEYINLPF